MCDGLFGEMDLSCARYMAQDKTSWQYYTLGEVGGGGCMSLLFWKHTVMTFKKFQSEGWADPEVNAMREHAAVWDHEDIFILYYNVHFSFSSLKSWSSVHFKKIWLGYI